MLGLSFLLLTAAAWDEAWKVFSLSDWAGGLNTFTAPNKLNPNQSQAMSNLMTDEKPGTFVTRRGFSLIVTTATLSKINLEYTFNKDDGSSEFIVSDSSIVLTTADLMHFTKIRGSLTSTSKLRALQIRNKVWFTNGADSVFTWDGSTCMVLDGQTYTATTTPNVPLGKYIAYYHSRVWLYNVPGNNSALRYSALASTDGFTIAPDDFRSWPLTQQLNINQGDGTVGTGLNVYATRLYVFKESSKYGIFGSDEFTYFARPVDAEVGSVSGDAISQLDGLQYYIGQNGIYQSDASNSKRISDDISGNVEDIQTNLTKVVSNIWDTQSDFERGTLANSTTTSGSFLSVNSTITANGISDTYSGVNATTLQFPSTSTIYHTVSTSALASSLNFSGFISSLTIWGKIGGNCDETVDAYFTYLNRRTGQIVNTSTQTFGTVSAIQKWGFISTGTLNATAADFKAGNIAIKMVMDNLQNTCGYEVSSFTVSAAQLLGLQGSSLLLTTNTAGFVSDITTTAGTVTFWQTLTSVDNSNGGSIQYFIKAATSSVNIATQPFVSITPGNNVPYAASNNVFQWASTMTFDARIDQVTINHNEGGATDSQPFAITWKNRYWLAVATTASGTQEIIYVKTKTDGPNTAWNRFDGINVKSFAIYNNSLYGGSGTNGSIYRLDYGTNDNGTAIAWTYKTPDLVFDIPFFEKDFKEIMVEAKRDGQTISLDYSVNGGTNTTIPISLASGNGRLLKSYYAVDKKGKYATFTIRGATLDKPVEFHSLGMIYNPQHTR